MNKIDYLSNNWLALKTNNDALKRRLHLISGRVIDMGCGDCPYKEDILRVAEEYIGVDWRNSLHRCSSVDVYADINEKLPFPDAYANTVVVFQVLEHLRKPLGFLKECVRLLAPGGMIIMTVPFMWGVHEEPYDYYRYTKYGLRYLLNEAGFVDIKVEENSYFWSTWILRFNYHTARYAKGIIKAFFTPVWFIDQVMALVFDRIDKNASDAASYTVLGIKP